MTDRDTKFAGFARLQMPELDVLFTGLYKAYIAGNIPLRDAYTQRIETYLTQRAYDLAVHVVAHSGDVTMADWPDSEIVSNLPDLTQWAD